jgi:hypothetical protein
MKEESTVTLAWWEKAWQFSRLKKGLLLASAGFAIKGLWEESSHPEMLKFTLVTVLVVELWVAFSAILARRAKTKQAKLIAQAAIATAFAVLVSNELAFIITPKLLTMKSYQAAQFFAGYGFFRWLFSTKDDGRKLKLNLLVWAMGTVAGGGVAINFNSAALQLSWARDYLGAALAVACFIGYLIAQKWGDSLDDEKSDNRSAEKSKPLNGAPLPAEVTLPPSGN